MKDKKQKKNKGESVIGKIIYGFLLFLPLFSIGVTCLVNTFNATAKEQKELKINYKYESNEVNSLEDLKDGNIYNLDFSVLDYSENSYYLEDVILDFDIYNPPGTVFYQHVNINGNMLYDGRLTITKVISSLYTTEYVYPIANRTLPVPSLKNFKIVISDNFGGIPYNAFSKCEDIPIESVEQLDKDLDNVFYDSIQAVENNNLFNWSKNSIIYTKITATCNALNITNTFIPMLLTYWLIISVIYFLYDIILMCVLILHNKIHEMQDSI